MLHRLQPGRPETRSTSGAAGGTTSHPTIRLSNTRRASLAGAAVALSAAGLLLRMTASPPAVGRSVDRSRTPPMASCEFTWARKGGRCPTCLSQQNQDLILERIFETIGETNRECVEFGFGYGNAENFSLADFGEAAVLSGLNTQALIAKKGWKGTFFDAETSNPEIGLYKHILTMDNITSVFKQHDVPINVDYVSIDVDSVDLWLFYGLLSGGYRPRVISIEYNNNFPVNMTITCERAWNPWVRGSRVYGSSASALNIIAEMYGYKLVEFEIYLDMFFVRKDILQDRCLNFEDLPDYMTLASNYNVGSGNHRFCDAQMASRLVDFPLSLIGLKDDAKLKAKHDIELLNQQRLQRGQDIFCNITAHK